MPSPQRRLRGLDDEPLQIWNILPFTNLIAALDAIKAISVPRAPLGLITGKAGSGKTFAAEVYAYNRKNVAIVTVPPKNIRTIRLLLEHLAAAVEVDPGAHLRKADLFYAIVNAVAAGGQFIIVDEADRLYAADCDMLREIADLTGKPLAFLGLQSVEAVLARVAATHHRIGFRHTTSPPDLEDVERALVGKALDTAGQRKLDIPTVQAIYQCTKGNPRHMDRLVNLLVGAERNGEKYAVKPESVVKLNRQFLKLAA